MTPIYIVTYAVADPKLYSGVLGSFSNLFAAKKYKEHADLALRNSGLEGTVELSTNIVGDNPEPNSFFLEGVYCER